MTKPRKFFTCDTCGNKYTEGEFVETIGEMLCQWCASGIEEADECDDDYDPGGQETCNDHYGEW